MPLWQPDNERAADRASLFYLAALEKAQILCLSPHLLLFLVRRLSPPRKSLFVASYSSNTFYQLSFSLLGKARHSDTTPVCIPFPFSHCIQFHRDLRKPTPHSDSFPIMQTDSEKSKVQVFFSSDVGNMDEWAKRTGIPLTTAEALGTTYARAHKWLLSLKSQLVLHHGWRETVPADRRMLVSIESPSIWKSTGGMPLSPPLKLQLPEHATSFFSPERRVQWQMVFHSDIFSTNRKLSQPIDDIFNLIQCLLTGVVTLVHDEVVPQGLARTTRGLPTVMWVNANEGALVEVFGQAHFKKLRAACNSTQASHKLEMLPQQAFFRR